MQSRAFPLRIRFGLRNVVNRMGLILKQLRAASFGLAVSALLSQSLRGAPFKPANDSFVVEKLPRSLVALQKVGSTRVEVRDLPTSVRVGREYLEIAQRSGDPAFVRYAEQLLAPWRGQPSLEVLFLGAVIRQHKHEFAGALDDLDRASKLAGNNNEIPLLRASILTTLGRYAEAKAIFAANLRLISTLRGLTIFLTAASQNGARAQSERTLERAINPHADPAEQAFAWCALAEMAVRGGDVAAAEARFRQALALEPADSYILSAYADLLLASGRAREVLPLIDSSATSEALITRRFLAMKTSREQVMPFIEQLTSSGHLRELAMLQLEVLNNAESALSSALANWANQKEPIDALLVLRSALASHRAPEARPVVDWLRATRLEDERIQPLLEELNVQFAQK